jgi:uncharacterized protein
MTRDHRSPQAARPGSLSAYFALTFALAWSLWLIAAALTAGMSTASRAPFFLPGTFAPAFVALWLSSRRGQTRELIDGVFRWRVPVRLYLFAATYMAAIKLTAAVAHRAITGAWPSFGSTPLLLMAVGVIFSMPVQAGEELGWRGYALPRLASRMGFPFAAVVLGAIWAVWHLPLFLIAGTDTTNQPFVVFLLSVTALSVAMTWLYVRTGASLLLVMLMHAAVNNTTGIVPSAAVVPPGTFALNAPLMAWLTAITLWIAAAYFLLRLSRTSGKAL